MPERCARTYLLVSLSVVGGVFIGGGAGYFAASWQPEAGAVENELLYGDREIAEQRIIETTQEARILVYAIHQILTDYRNRRPIEPERKNLLTSELVQRLEYDEVLLSLALGAAHDENEDVRQTCVNALVILDDAMDKSRQIISRSLSRERTEAVRQSKKEFIQN